MGISVMLGATAAIAGSDNLLVFVGTYTTGDSKGIYTCRLDTSSGAISHVGVTEGIANPSFLAIHPSRPYLFAVAEVTDFGGGGASGGVASFAIDPTVGRLKLLNQQRSEGGSPCHLVVDRQGKFVLVANYTGGNVAVLPIRSDGHLGRASSVIQHVGKSVHPKRQQGPHAHSIKLDAANQFAFAADLGLDKILVYRFNAQTGLLAAHQPPSVSLEPGAGPRHFAFHPNGRFAYVINEMQCTVTALQYDSHRGVLEPLQTLPTLPTGTDLNRKSTAEVQVHRSGEFLYGSNRGHDSIVVYRIDPKDGKLTFVEHESTQGRTPRNFGIDPSGSFLLAANQSTNTIVVFRIDPASGKLAPTGHQCQVPSPVCIKFLQRSPG